MGNKIRSVAYRVERYGLHDGKWKFEGVDAKVPTVKDAVAYAKSEYRSDRIRFKIVKVSAEEISDIDGELMTESRGEQDTDSQKKAVIERDEANGYPTARGPNASYNDWGCLRGIDISLRRIADVIEDKMKGRKQ